MLPPTHQHTHAQHRKRGGGGLGDVVDAQGSDGVVRVRVEREDANLIEQEPGQAVVCCEVNVRKEMHDPVNNRTE